VSVPLAHIVLRARLFLFHVSRDTTITALAALGLRPVRCVLLALIAQAVETPVSPDSAIPVITVPLDPIPLYSTKPFLVNMLLLVQRTSVFVLLALSTGKYFTHYYPFLLLFYFNYCLVAVCLPNLTARCVRRGTFARTME
jgi:hypothetical protein